MRFVRISPFNLVCLILLCLVCACGPQDHPAIPKAIARAAAKGDAGAQFKIARLYANEGKDSEQEIYWYEKAAVQDHEDSILALAKILRKHARSGDDYKKASVWNEKAAKLGDAAAAYFMGFAVRENLAGQKSLNSSYDWFVIAAEKKHVAAMYELGRFYESKGHYDEAVKWYLNSSQQGDKQAKLSLVDMYLFGHGFPVNHDRAIQYLRDLAEEGMPIAEYSLARFYDEGRYVKMDKIRAGEWYAKAARQNIKAALYKLTINKKTCLDPHADKGSLWANACFIAMSLNDGNISYQIAMFYSVGQYLPASEIRAHEWFLKAAKQGNERAPLALAKDYLLGRGTGRNTLEAYSWLAAYESLWHARNPGLDLPDDAERNKRALIDQLSLMQGLQAPLKINRYENYVFRRCAIQRSYWIYFRYIQTPFLRAKGAVDLRV